MSSRYVKERLDIQYPRVEILGSYLTKWFGNNYHIWLRNGKITLSIPRHLADSERDALRAANYHSQYDRQNRAIRLESLPSRNPAITHTGRSAKESDAHKTNSEGGFEPNEDLVTPDINTIPLFRPASQKTVQGFEQVVFELEQSDTYKKGNKIQSGFYSSRLEVGETSSVFDIKSHILLSVDQPGRLQADRVVQKASILHPPFKPAVIIKNDIDHPHIVETLVAFRYEENGEQYFNFMFPLAFGNLKRLFRGSYDDDIELQRRTRDSLWDQFAGLSSAVAYLHDSIQMAHRDIKPSNILIYETPSPKGSLILKLTDFGLAIDLSKAPTWEVGSRALQSAWEYDSPESRTRSPNVGSKNPIGERFEIPSATDLLANDIWKLGCVFTEIVAFLVCGGSAGVAGFRDHITTTGNKISSDVFNDTRFDDDEKVKDQVLEWIDRMARRDSRAKQLQPILGQMLAKSAKRPTIKEVCEELVKETTFIPANHTNPLSRTEKLKLIIEERIGRRVDWWPFPRPRPKLRPDQFLMTWEWQGIELCMSLSQDELNRYKSMCSPITTNRIPLLPVANPSTSSSRHVPATVPSNAAFRSGGTNSPPTLGNVALGGAAVRSSAALPTPVPTKDMYWCVEKTFTEPTENHLFPILNSETLHDDEELYRQVNKAIRSACGWIGLLFSWKRCTAVDFIEFCVVWKHGSQVDPMKVGLLPPSSAQDYTHSVPNPHDVHMRAAGKQIVGGLRSPMKGRGDTTITAMLPKKLNPPPFAREMGQVGWGLHVKMSFSAWRFIYWLILCFVLNFVFVALWLVYITHTDLQNAFVPATISTAALTFGLFVIQMSEMRRSQ
ncbi:uncharacterized protein NECHADRAFT_86595 [Fusarium vanettenii 77-13-4]|uniref:non-specific serine/threonine protein kinase n=1 Tax=Fusarium vanettenii (strain ATCC MYA-4622 / CBS 123669 / FGSC 9596 / NRRL 45880 / 77-13-4) TaxID=660122 RepID=C7ZHC3_FUSV7|nr:uncharacterized protein NECHADRAFT_86595 [Fusarium vanettenii 77-13-4]EEU36747.1 predicted protein [Fusarium vanettenii 77-13-4]